MNLERKEKSLSDFRINLGWMILLKYKLKLIDCYGIEFVKKGKNRYDSRKLKEEKINKGPLIGRSQRIFVLIMFSKPK